MSEREQSQMGRSCSGSRATPEGKDKRECVCARVREWPTTPRIKRVAARVEEIGDSTPPRANQSAARRSHRQKANEFDQPIGERHTQSLRVGGEKIWSGDKSERKRETPSSPLHHLSSPLSFEINIASAPGVVYYPRARLLALRRTPV